MTIEIINGCLLDALDRGDVNVAVHCVNSKRVFGSGIALAIKNRYPEVYEHYQDNLDFDLGDVLYSQTNNGGEIANLYGQDDFGTQKRQGNYGAISCGLSSIAFIIRMTEKNEVVGFPYKICSDRAGCDWEIILEMIEFYFKGLPVKIYKL